MTHIGSLINSMSQEIDSLTIELEVVKSIPHTVKWHPNTWHICTIFFINTTLLKNHMIELHGFLDDSNECKQCESIQLGGYVPVGSQNIFIECISCQFFFSDIENSLI